MVAENPDLEGMGTTVTALLFDGTRLGIAHVGDSRAYLWRAGVLSQITHDDTFVQSLIDEGRITEAEAAIHPQRSLLLRAINGSDVEPSLINREVRVGDRYLICSDGLSGVISAEAIADTLASYETSDAADRLIELALRGGGPDNVTVVVADVVDTGESPDPDDDVPASPLDADATGPMESMRFTRRMPRVPLPKEPDVTELAARAQAQQDARRPRGRRGVRRRGRRRRQPTRRRADRHRPPEDPEVAAPGRLSAGGRRPAGHRRRARRAVGRQPVLRRRRQRHRHRLPRRRRLGPRSAAVQRAGEFLRPGGRGLRAAAHRRPGPGRPRPGPDRHPGQRPAERQRDRRPAGDAAAAAVLVRSPRPPASDHAVRRHGDIDPTGTVGRSTYRRCTVGAGPIGDPTRTTAATPLTAGRPPSPPRHRCRRLHRRHGQRHRRARLARHGDTGPASTTSVAPGTTLSAEPADPGRQLPDRRDDHPRRRRPADPDPVGRPAHQPPAADRTGRRTRPAGAGRADRHQRADPRRAQPEPGDLAGTWPGTAARSCWSTPRRTPSSGCSRRTPTRCCCRWSRC